jgi:hypothetical protein
MIVLAYFGSLYTKFHADGCTCWFLRPFIWSLVSGPMQHPEGSDSECASNCVQISEEVQLRPWSFLEKLLGKPTWDVHGKPKLKETKSTETCEKQSQEHAHHFLWHQGDCSQIIRPAGQTVNSAYYCDVLLRLRENVWIIHHWLWRPKNSVSSRQRTVSYSLFHRYFSPKTTWLQSLTNPTFLCFPDWRQN